MIVIINKNGRELGELKGIKTELHHGLEKIHLAAPRELSNFLMPGESFPTDTVINELITFDVVHWRIFDQDEVRLVAQPFEEDFLQYLAGFVPIGKHGTCPRCGIEPHEVKYFKQNHGI